MVSVVCCGQAVVDFVFQVSAMPTASEKYRADDVSIVGGGCAATAAVAAARLGGSVRMIGRLGDDDVGHLIMDGLQADDVDCAQVRRVSGGRSSCSSILVDAAGERQIVNFRGSGLPDTADWVEIGDAAVVLADTRWVSGAAAVLEQARDAGIPGILDAEAPIEPALAHCASHVAFSRQGLAAFTGLESRDEGLKDAARRLVGRWVAVTDGANGTFVADATDQICIPAPVVSVVDTLGAGDVWHGAFALALGEGRPAIDAVIFANAAAALKCTRSGGRAGAPTRAETDTFIKDWNPCI